MEILGCKVLLPALVNFKHNGVESSAFVYIDHAGKDVIFADVDSVGLEDVGPLKEAILAHVVAQKRPFIIPPTPEEGFSKMRPETYMNNEQQ